MVIVTCGIRQVVDEDVVHWCKPALQRWQGFEPAREPGDAAHFGCRAFPTFENSSSEVLLSLIACLHHWRRTYLGSMLLLECNIYFSDVIAIARRSLVVLNFKLVFLRIRPTFLSMFHPFSLSCTDGAVQSHLRIC
jgi:hypothetical protein